VAALRFSWPPRLVVDEPADEPTTPSGVGPAGIGWTGTDGSCGVTDVTLAMEVAGALDAVEVAPPTVPGPEFEPGALGPGSGVAAASSETVATGAEPRSPGGALEVGASSEGIG
jgi:hypothetical protein